VAYQRALGMEPGTDERHAMGRLPQHFADMHGWPELAATVADVWHRLSPEERARGAIFGRNYGEAGAVSVLGARLGLPEAISGHNSFWLWGPGQADGSLVLVIGGDEADHRASFAVLERGAVASHAYAMPYEQDLVIWIGRRLVRGPRELWPALRHYD
jgi:hypothetical protein